MPQLISVPWVGLDWVVAGLASLPAIAMVGALVWGVLQYLFGE
jgi:hypothetical protein